MCRTSLLSQTNSSPWNLSLLMMSLHPSSTTPSLKSFPTPTLTISSLNPSPLPIFQTPSSICVLPISSNHSQLSSNSLPGVWTKKTKRNSTSTASKKNSRDFQTVSKGLPLSSGNNIVSLLINNLNLSYLKPLITISQKITTVISIYKNISRV